MCVVEGYTNTHMHMHTHTHAHTHTHMYTHTQTRTISDDPLARRESSSSTEKTIKQSFRASLWEVRVRQTDR